MMIAGELLAVKEVSLTVEDTKRKEAITQIEQEVLTAVTLATRSASYL
jgi:hypothetical protein